MPKCALPDHLKEKKHNDWIWPLSHIPRAWNAFGPRCFEGSYGYKKWPPQLIKGHGVSRWEDTHFGLPINTPRSIIYIPEFDKETITSSIYNHNWDAVETNPAHPDYLNLKSIRLFKNGGYSPSALQRFSKKGWMVLSPFYFCQWHLVHQVNKRLGMSDIGKEDYFMFHRQGFRPDHEDSYYNWGPMLGLKMD